ncbi:MAG: SUMF1/EgtB/PvdO family nonheme iron enzyme [Myxococcota bacterium]
MNDERTDDPGAPATASDAAGREDEFREERDGAAPLDYPRGMLIAARYEIVDRLGDSPLGTTFRAKHLESGDYVRLLLIAPSVSPGGPNDGLREAMARGQRIVHENVLAVRGLEQHEAYPVVVFEDTEGQSLRDLLNERRGEGSFLTLNEAAQITSQVLQGLGAVHEAGLVFRGLRPEHVLVDASWKGPRQQTFVAKVKIAYAGFWDLISPQVLAEDEFARGEAQYLAPELKGFEPTPSPGNDVYSAGVLFYEMLMGKAPVGTFQLPRSRRPELPEHVNNIIEVVLSQVAEDRYPSVQDFLHDLQRMFTEPTFADQPESQPLISPVGWAAACGIVIVLALGLYNLRSDPAEQAFAADEAIRTRIERRLNQGMPTRAEINAMYERHPSNMIYIPEGPYLAGRLHAEMQTSLTEPLAEERTTPGYLIDMFEYPNLKGAEPMAAVSYVQAEQICEEAGKRLCTADEWERACKGPHSTVYGYNYAHAYAFDEGVCGRGVEDAHLAGERGECQSGWGVYDVSGSVREWTSTRDGRGRALVKGGLKSQPEKGTRCATSNDESVNFADRSIGFRCCRDPDAPAVNR